MIAKILVAEDDALTARFLLSLLESEGYRVEWAADGEAAIRAARAERPDLILTDLVMPYRDGYRVLKDVRNDEKLRDVPVILMSMKDREDDVVRALDEGADDYVIKPFGARELLARIRKRLDDRGARG